MTFTFQLWTHQQQHMKYNNTLISKGNVMIFIYFLTFCNLSALSMFCIT